LKGKWEGFFDHLRDGKLLIQAFRDLGLGESEHHALFAVELLPCQPATKESNTEKHKYKKFETFHWEMVEKTT
jgi:hypothetical protein